MKIVCGSGWEPGAGAAPSRAPFRKISEERRHEGHVISLGIGTFEGPDGERFTRDIVHHPGAVSVVPLLEDDRVVLVRQYRAALDAWLLEIPAGKRDVPGEAPEVTAGRELAEEVGYVAAELELLLNAITVTHTWFMRDAGQLAIISAVLEARPQLAPPLKVWVPGCATGEDVYSVAMLAEQAEVDDAWLAGLARDHVVEHDHRPLVAFDRDAQVARRFKPQRNQVNGLRKELAMAGVALGAGL